MIIKNEETLILYVIYKRIGVFLLNLSNLQTSGKQV